MMEEFGYAIGASRLKRKYKKLLAKVEKLRTMLCPECRAKLEEVMNEDDED